MISHISGILEQVENNLIIIDVNGIGYKIFVPISLLNSIGTSGDKVKIFTTLLVREDSISLYGFKTKEEKNLFNSLLNVSGIGPKSALGLISALSVNKLVSAIASGDVDVLSSVSGVGKKTAQRIVVELKDKMGKIYGIKPSELAVGVPGESSLISDAISALMTLGYLPKEARDLLLKRDLSGANNIEDVIKIALKNSA